MKRHVLLLLFLGLSFAALASCATTRPEPGALREIPDRFLVGSSGGDETAEPAPGEGCRYPMIDPRDRTRLVLVRSAQGFGDYEVPAGRYGVAEGQLLRLDCATGHAVKIVLR